MYYYKGIILIADDEELIVRMLKDLLNNYGYGVIEAKDGEEALELFKKNLDSIDLVILDIMMPKKDGIEVLKEIRNLSSIPIIMLTAKSEEYDELSGLTNGADDYISKPFFPSLLIARIENIFKRCNKLIKNNIVANDIIIDNLKREAYLNGIILDLTKKEYDLLLYFIEHKNIALTREELLNNVWNYDYIGDSRTVDTHIKQLRFKLTNEHDYIKTIRGVGYRFEV